MGGMLLAAVTVSIASQAIPSLIQATAEAIQYFKFHARAKSKTKTKATPIPMANTESQKPKYWQANYNNATKLVDIGIPITKDLAIERVSEGKSIMSVDYNSARQVAMLFPGTHIPEINKEAYGTPDYYPHFHINFGHGDPHIWYYSSNMMIQNP